MRQTHGHYKARKKRMETRLTIRVLNAWAPAIAANRRALTNATRAFIGRFLGQVTEVVDDTFDPFGKDKK